MGRVSTSFDTAFAVKRMLLWHRQGIDLDQAMLSLSTYLGHAKISNTYWYLSAVPELMALAGKRFERFAAAPGAAMIARANHTRPSFPALVQALFAEHLTQQRALSPRTVATYRDAFVAVPRFCPGALCEVAHGHVADGPYARVDPGASSIILSASGTTRSAAVTRDWPLCARS